MANYNLSCDVFVNGLTPAGVGMAWQAARTGARVIAAHHTNHIGGMPADGLLSWDIGSYDTRHQGESFRREYFRRLNYYAGSDSPTYRAIPWFHDAVCWNLLEEYGVTVIVGCEVATVNMTGTNMSSIVLNIGATADTYTVSAYNVLEAEYENSILVKSPITKTIGRESMAQYGETYAGFGQNMTITTAPTRDDLGNLIMGIEALPASATGDADLRVQTMAFRVPISQVGHGGDGRPWSMPHDYDEDHFRRLIPFPENLVFTRVATPSSYGASELNFDSFASSGYSWATGTWAQRGKGPDDGTYSTLWQKLYSEQAGFYYFLAHDPRVPYVTRVLYNKWGPLKNQYNDNGSWPRMPYLREGYRMVGDYVITQQHIQTPERSQTDSVSAGSYPLDRHTCALWELPGGGSYYRDNNIASLPAANILTSPLRILPFQVPFRSLISKASDCVNFGTVTGASCSSIGWSSFRLEPIFMNAGNALGYAAAKSALTSTPLHSLNIATLKSELEALGQVTEPYVP